MGAPGKKHRPGKMRAVSDGDWAVGGFWGVPVGSAAPGEETGNFTYPTESPGRARGQGVTFRHK